ncbi:MAG: CehA/McbA family metallohydrolase, partial [Myxococcaceae bacterium]|nr:CehA/McbA family metallohydrolase [Myxococcaceae bacterium]
MSASRAATALLVLAVSSCTGRCAERPLVLAPGNVRRCEVDLGGTGLFQLGGLGARAHVLAVGEERSLGPGAQAQPGDVLLQNARVRFVIQQPGRYLGPVPYGGALIDADLQRPPGEPGRDVFGKLGLFYNFGRTVAPEAVEVLASGEDGGPVVVAATGNDVVNEYLDLETQLVAFFGRRVTFAARPNVPRPLRITTYYVLSPEESRLRILSALCNEGEETLALAMGDFIDQGGPSEFFAPGACGGLGLTDCPVFSFGWFGFQGEGVAYGYRTYDLDAPREAVRASVFGNYAGVGGILASGRDVAGVLTWLGERERNRPGTLEVRPGEPALYLRDFIVGTDLADVSSTWARLTGLPTGRLEVRVRGPGDVPPPIGTRVAVMSEGAGAMLTLAIPDAEGRSVLDVAPSRYTLMAGRAGGSVEAQATVQVAAQRTTRAALEVPLPRRLTVQVRDPAGAPMPAKVVVRCEAGPCPRPDLRLGDVEKLPDDVRAVAFVPPEGTVVVLLPPGAYRVQVTRGPEFSAWPDTFPNVLAPADLTQGDVTLTAMLARVVDTSGWMSADLHVHAVNSSDSTLPNLERVRSFLAEGVDVLVSTDHDVVTDYAPVIQALGAGAFLASVTGDEVTTPAYGHFNAFPFPHRDTPTGGAYDWFEGGFAQRLSQLFPGLRAVAPGVVVQLNHPRGLLGALSLLRVDTLTSASHADPAALRMAPAPDATPADTRLFSDDYDAFEVALGFTPSFALLNDWMTFLSRGLRRTATGVSDSHTALRTVGGYSRTYVDMEGRDAPAAFDASVFTASLRAQRAFGTNGPFVRLSAARVSAVGLPLAPPVGMGGTVSVAPGLGERVRLTVDVQAPEWMRFDAVELYTHAPGREAFDGMQNDTWPEERVLQRQTFDPEALPLEVVPLPGGLTARRVHLTTTFEVSPAADTWYVVLVRGRERGSGLSPLAWHGVMCDADTGVCSPVASLPFAFTNPVFVDADGSGAYD